MNLLFAYPIIMPVSSGGGGEIPIEFVWSTLIVVNGIGVISFLIAFIINKLKNKVQEYEKENLLDTICDYILIALGVGLAAFVDLLAIFIILILWVSTLL